MKNMKRQILRCVSLLLAIACLLIDRGASWQLVPQAQTNPTSSSFLPMI
jgi:hypothetical protein